MRFLCGNDSYKKYLPWDINSTTQSLALMAIFAVTILIFFCIFCNIQCFWCNALPHLQICSLGPLGLNYSLLIWIFLVVGKSSIFAVTSFKIWLYIFQESCKLLESVFKLLISVYGYRLLFSCLHQILNRSSRKSRVFSIHKVFRLVGWKYALLKGFTNKQYSWRNLCSLSFVLKHNRMSSNKLHLGKITYFSTHLVQVLWTVEQLAFVHSAEGFPVALQFTALESGVHAGHLSTSLFATSLRVRFSEHHHQW